MKRSSARHPTHERSLRRVDRWLVHPRESPDERTTYAWCLLLRELRINTRIRASRVSLVGDGAPEQLSVGDALARARSQGLDLVEVDPSSAPPVVRILDYGRYKYDQQKRERAARKASKPVELKEIRFSPKIDDGDLAVRIRQTHGFLSEGHKVKVSVRHRGREQSHPEIARALLAKVIEATTAVGSVDRAPATEGRYLFMILVPGKRQ